MPAQNIKDVAPLLATHFIDVTNKEEDYTPNNKLVAQHKDQLGAFYNYLNLLHDSEIIKTKQEADRFSLILTDITTQIFAETLAAKKGIDVENGALIFPLQLKFEVSNLSYYTIDEQGWMQEIATIPVQVYLYEQITAVSKEEITITVVAWQRNENSGGQYVLILITAKSITVAEEQDTAWASYFGAKYDGCYRYFKAQRKPNKYLADHGICEAMIDEYDKSQN